MLIDSWLCTCYKNRYKHEILSSCGWQELTKNNGIFYWSTVDVLYYISYRSVGYSDSQFLIFLLLL